MQIIIMLSYLSAINFLIHLASLVSFNFTSFHTGSLMVVIHRTFKAFPLQYLFHKSFPPETAHTRQQWD